MHYDAEKWKKFLKENMSEKRFVHSCNVADMAAELAEIHGCDVKTAYTAGLLHDICKEFPKEKQLEYVKKSDLDVSEEEINSYKLWHGIAGAYYLKKKCDNDDIDFLRAVRYHTVGRPEMSLLEKIIYVADMVSRERKMPCVPAIRALARENLELAVLEELRVCMMNTIDSGNAIPPSTIEAYNYYIKFLNK